MHYLQALVEKQIVTQFLCQACPDYISLLSSNMFPIYSDGMGCVHNAYKAVLLLRQKGYSPRVWFIIGVNHAYLELEGEVYNEGVTWMNNHYPNYDINQIKELEEKVKLKI